VILVIGGAFSGKTDYVISTLGFSESEISCEINSDTPVLSGLHQLLRDIKDIDAVLPKLLEKKVIICDEVGCGIVPAEKKDRLWRERVGRTCCRLVEDADAVVRLNCGIASVIKGEIACEDLPLTE